MSADFIDSNIFIYLFDETADAKRGMAESNTSGELSGSSECPCTLWVLIP